MFLPAAGGSGLGRPGLGPGDQLAVTPHRTAEAVRQQGGHLEPLPGAVAPVAVAEGGPAAPPGLQPHPPQRRQLLVGRIRQKTV